MFHIINAFPENGPHQFQKLREALRQGLTGDGLDEVTEVIPTVKGNVGHILVTDKPRRHHELREVRDGHAILESRLEIEALVAEEVDRGGGVFVAGDVEVAEIELPDEAAVGTAEVREVPGGVGERDPHLNQFESVDIRFEGFVVVEGVGVVVVVVAEDDAGELGVHGDKREAIYEVADEREFVVNVLGPNRADQDRFLRVDRRRRVRQTRIGARRRGRGWRRRRQLERWYVGGVSGDHGGVSRLKLMAIAEFGGKIRVRAQRDLYAVRGWVRYFITLCVNSDVGVKTVSETTTLGRNVNKITFLTLFYVPLFLSFFSKVKPNQ